MSNINNQLLSLKTDFVTEEEEPKAPTLEDFDPNPIIEFNKWLDQAVKANYPFANAMCLATSTPKGKPSSRMLLLKEVTSQGFVFFSHYNSRKGKELEANPYASLLFFWSQAFRQVRIEGEVSKLPSMESDKYFQQRPRESQINAWASKQSQPATDINALHLLAKELEEKFADVQIPRPKHWGGYILKPTSIEFWQQGKNRFHTRILYTKKGSKWVKQYLNP